MRRLFSIGLWILLAASAAYGDVIVLKSGRRITATEVVEVGDRYTYETPAGRFSVRKDQVERIERRAPAPPPALSEIQVDAPRIERTDEEVAAAVIKDGAIDRSYIARLENDPQYFTVPVANRIAYAHHTAAQFELQKGNLDAAVGHYRRALTFAPDHIGTLLSVSYLHLRRSEFSQAAEYLERANRLSADTPDVPKLLGWAYYGQNKIEPAVREWKRALALRKDPDTEQALQKAMKDLQTESAFLEGETQHFTLRYHGGAAPELARDILRTLEDHFRAIETELNFAPPEPIGVILYTQQEFVDITRAPAWAGAINDGRIRLPVQGLTSVTSDLSASLKHELTHSFVHQKTRGRAPVWMHEGIAQWMEGKRSGDNASLIVQAYERRVALPLKSMEGAWTNMQPDVAGFAYAWSLAIVEYMHYNGGSSDIVRVLDRLEAEGSPEQAVRSVIRMDYADLEAETVKYIKRTYSK